MDTMAEPQRRRAADGRWRRHLFVLLHVVVVAGCTGLFAWGWETRDRAGEVDVTAIFAGVPVWLVALPWSLGFFVTDGTGSAPLQFPAVIALAWVNVAIHYATLLWYRIWQKGRWPTSKA